MGGRRRSAQGLWNLKDVPIPSIYPKQGAAETSTLKHATGTVKRSFKKTCSWTKGWLDKKCQSSLSQTPVKKPSISQCLRGGPMGKWPCTPPPPPLSSPHSSGSDAQSLQNGVSELNKELIFHPTQWKQETHQLPSRDSVGGIGKEVIFYPLLGESGGTLIIPWS